jgi:hypothetical protein
MRRCVSLVLLLVSVLFVLQAEASNLVNDSLGSGTVLDKETGLRWQQQDDGKKYNWYDAQKYCGSLKRGGESDWRLPSKDELLTIRDSSIPDPRPKIDTAYFWNAKSGWYWSSTTHPVYPEGALLVDFGSSVWHGNDKVEYCCYVRCVRDEK